MSEQNTSLEDRLKELIENKEAVQVILREFKSRVVWDHLEFRHLRGDGRLYNLAFTIAEINFLTTSPSTLIDEVRAGKRKLEDIPYDLCLFYLPRYARAIKSGKKASPTVNYLLHQIKRFAAEYH